MDMGNWSADTAVVLGSGLGMLVEAMEVTARLPFAEVAGMPVSTVAGHAGEFVAGHLGGVPVILMAGRVHLYEGHDARAVTAGVRWLAGRGVKRLILTNAAGAVNPGFAPGTWMMVADHLNLTGTSPLEGGPNFFDMSEVYSPAWRDEWRWAASRRGMTLHEGVYAGLRGPQYETPAEVRMLRLLGADAVGMSTVLEAIAARAAGMETVAFSCLTNWAAGIKPAALDHAEVLATGRAVAGQMARLLEEVISGHGSRKVGKSFVESPDRG